MPLLNFRCVVLALIGCLVQSYVMPRAALACAVAYPERRAVQIANEEAVIVWDEATHTQHFIRRATFEAASRDFGFLVPTPDTPKMAEANDAVFTVLHDLIRPKIIREPERGVILSSLFFGDFGGDEDDAVAGSASRAPNAAMSSVSVISTQRVAGYDAVVLAADDAKALVRWLQKHGYKVRPDLSSWLTSYIKARWKITAFKIAKTDAREQQTSTSLVRMSFRTDKPIFPYREPADQRATDAPHSHRLLRVFMLSQSRMEGALGTQPSNTVWPGRVTWANQLSATNLDEPKINNLSRDLALTANGIKPDMWLTTFEDRASPRPGIEDIYFSSAANQTKVEPPPIVIRSGDARVRIPVEMILLVASLGCGIYVWSTRHH